MVSKCVIARRFLPKQSYWYSAHTWKIVSLHSVTLAMTLPSFFEQVLPSFDLPITFNGNSSVFWRQIPFQRFKTFERADLQTNN